MSFEKLAAMIMAMQGINKKAFVREESSLTFNLFCFTILQSCYFHGQKANQENVTEKKKAFSIFLYKKSMMCKRVSHEVFFSIKVGQSGSRRRMYSIMDVGLISITFKNKLYLLISY